MINSIQVDENKTQMRLDVSRKQVEMNMMRREGADVEYLHTVIRGGTNEDIGIYSDVINNPVSEELSLISSLAVI